MFSFEMLLNQMENDLSSPLMNSGEETKAIQVIRSGLSLRNDGETSFWEDFIQLCSNSEGLAELLGVKQESVVSWASRIRESLEKAEQLSQNDPHRDKDKTELLPTGDNGAVNMNNMGPFGKMDRGEVM